MLLITVGTEEYQFNALMHWIEILINYQLIDEEVIVQYGSSTYFPDGAKCYRWFSQQNLSDFVDTSSLVISHCDEDIAQLLEDQDATYILVPRLRKLHEYIDNYQMEVADDFERRGIAIARSIGDLVKFIKLQQTSELIPSVDETQLCEYLKSRYPPQRLMLICDSGGYFRYMQSLKKFWGNYSDRTWISLRTNITIREIEDRYRFWAYDNVNKNPINILRNLILAINIVIRRKSHLVVCAGSSFVIPFLLVYKLFCHSKIVYIESKTRFKDISSTAWILMKLNLLDLIIVRSKAIACLYPQSVYIPVNNNINQDRDECSPQNTPQKDYKQASIVIFNEVAFIYSPERFEFSTVREFINNFQSICNSEDFYKKIVIDMSRTTSIDSAGFGALTHCLKMTTMNGTELVLWSVSEAISSLISVSSLSNLFNIELHTNPLRFSNSTQTTRVSDTHFLSLFLFQTQKLFKKVPIFRVLYLILKFFFPWLDIDPSVPTHPSVRDPIKRLIDIVGALIGLVITGILFIPIAIGIILESEGGVLFGQVRCGLLSKPFRIWKFRSMVQNAEQLKNKVENEVLATVKLDDSPSKNDHNHKFFKNATDPRITKIGRFLRKTSLDEFPQFWNVLIGDMSLVGTRPPTFNEISCYELEIEYDDERYTEWNRLDVKPGITGVWQVNGRSSVKSFAEVVNYDIEYRKKWSIWYDLKLIMQTFCVLFDRNNKAV